MVDDETLSKAKLALAFFLLTLLSLLIQTTEASSKLCDPDPIESLVSWPVYCDNDEPRDGFRLGSWSGDFCVPGEITNQAYYCGSPNGFTGVMSSYAPGMMEHMCEKAGGCKGYVDGVALMSCADVGKEVYLQLPGRGWEGPFLVVDCSRKEHMLYHVVQMGLAVEVGYKTAERWGVRAAPFIRVSTGRPGNAGWSYRGWWMSQCMAFEEPPFNIETICIGRGYICRIWLDRIR